MKLTQLKVKVIAAADDATLETEVNEWLQDTTATNERTYIALHFSTDGGAYRVLIEYTE